MGAPMNATITTDDATYRYVGITDECVQCEKCGKAELKSTVVLSILDADGNHTDYVYYGSTCAARALKIKGGGRAVLAAARGAMSTLRDMARWAQEVLAYYQLPESGDADDYALHYARLAYQLCNSGRGGFHQSAEGWLADTVEMMRRHQATLAHARHIGLKLDDPARVAAKQKIMRALEGGLLKPISEPGSLRISVRAAQGGQLTRVFLDATGAVQLVEGPLREQITTALNMAARRSA